MRGLSVLLSTALMAQVTTAPKPQSTATKPKPAAAKPSSTQKTTSTASKGSATTKTLPAARPTPMTDDEKTIYALGLSVSQSLAPFDLSPAELEILKQALTDAAAGKPAVELPVWGPKIQTLGRARTQRVGERAKAASQEYLAKVGAEPGVVKTDSGLLYREVRAGTGASPKPTDTVKVNYRGTLVNGTEFDSSYARNEPAEFALNRVIPCWTEGLQKMKVGGKATLVCPAQIAYGETGQGAIPGGAALIFDVELLAVNGAADRPPQ